MAITIIITILFLTLLLSGIGAYIAIHKSNKEKETEESSKILQSGRYAVALRSAADSLAEKKPGKTELEEWLNSQNISSEQKSKLLKSWQSSINETIKTINEGDINGVTTYRVALGPKDRSLCLFLQPNHFITREQVSRHAEILPPYCLGSDSVIVPKHPWEKDDETSGWQAVLPKDGHYDVPDWQQINY